MKAEILAIGTELLLGDILNTNAQFLSRELASLGIYVYYQSVVGDNAERIKSSLELAFSRADLVITTGGLGPTADDMSKEITAEFFGLPLVYDQKAVDDMAKRLGGFDFAKSNVKQAYVPEGSTVLYNAWGTAPGVIVEKDGKTCVNLPGPPRECVPMFNMLVRPWLRERQDRVLVSRTLRLFGIGESSAAEKILDLMEKGNPSIAPYAQRFELILRMTASAPNEADAAAMLEPLAKDVYSRLGAYIYGEGEEGMEVKLCELLRGKGLTIALAESCTGGLIASALTSVPGASDVLLEGAVTYSNESKIRRLGVKPETLGRFGAVSSETAGEMAAGIRETSGADIGLSVTGIAGPGGGSGEKPVGRVYIGIADGTGAAVHEYTFRGDREQIRMRTMKTAMNLVRESLI